MVLLDYPFGQAEAEAPASFFGGEAGFEDLLEIPGGDALTGIGNVDQDLFLLVLDVDGNRPSAFHGVEGVLEQVFDHPVEQRAGDAGGDLCFLGEEEELDLAGCAFPDIFHHAADLGNQVVFFEMGLAADLAEAVGDKFEAVDILLDLLNGAGIDRRFLQHLNPAFQRGNGRTELVSRLLRHPGPKLVLGSFVADGNGIEDEEDKERDDEQLYEGIIAHFIQQAGMAVVVAVGDIGFLAEDDYERRVVLGLELLQLLVQIVGVPAGLGGVQVDIFHDTVLLRGLDNGDGLLAIADQVREGKVHIGVFEDGLGGVYPQLHLLTFVLRDLAGKILGIEDRGAHNDDGYQGQQRSPIQ